VLEYSDGWLFVGRDGLLYRASYGRANGLFPGWEVSWVCLEWRGAVYPPLEG
jgi:hypothetical protein